MRNPYIVVRPLTDQDFYYGRDPSFALLERYLRDGRRLLLLSGRLYIGKTSFLNQLPSRLGTHYVSRRVEWDGLEALGEDLVWRIVVGISQALGEDEPDREAYEAGGAAPLFQHFQTMIAAKGSTTYLICFDSVPAIDFAADKGWSQALIILSPLLEESPNLAILLTIEGRPVDLGAEFKMYGIPQIVLGPLREEETEDTLMTPVRGVMSIDFQAIHRIHRLAGGDPLLVQLFGRILFEQRASIGWAGLPEVENVIDEIVALGAPQFEASWDVCSPAAQVVLCTFPEMVGHHSVASADDIAFYLAQLRIQIPMQDIEDALVELLAQGLVERLGDETYRLSNDLIRHWLKENKSALDTIQQTRKYRRAHLRRISPLKNKRIDWASALLWLAAGLIALLILFVWRSRQARITWTVEPTPAIATKSVAQETPAIVLPTPEKGVAPGHVIYIGKEAASSTWEIYAMRSDGSDPVQLTDNQDNDTSPVWSPDGRHIAFVSDRDGNREVYVMNADGNEQLNLTMDPAGDWTPAWSPDGQCIAFSSFRDGNWEIYVINADGSDPERLTRNGALDYGPSWSPDGQRIAFVSDRDGNLEIYIMNVEGDQQTRFTDDPATDQDPAWSPDGKQIAWASYRDDNMEVYVANVDGSEMRNLSRDAYADDHGPVWSPWGTHVAFFSNRDGGWDIYTLDLETGERVNLTASTLLEQSPSWGP